MHVYECVTVQTGWSSLSQQDKRFVFSINTHTSAWTYTQQWLHPCLTTSSPPLHILSPLIPICVFFFYLNSLCAWVCILTAASEARLLPQRTFVGGGVVRVRCKGGGRTSTIVFFCFFFYKPLTFIQTHTYSITSYITRY